MAMSLDALFKKEFNELMHSFNVAAGSVSIDDIPVPQGFTRVSTNGVYIKGITEQYFDALNDSVGELYTDILRRRTFDFIGEFFTDENGDYVYEDVSVPTDSVAIVSTRNIQLPYATELSAGFEYVDYIEKDGKTWYIYIVPKGNVYRLNRTALVLSWTRQTRYYSGLHIATCFGKMVYLQVIPRTKERDYETFRVLASKYSIDYSQEVKILSQFWLQNGIIFNKNDCVIDDPNRGTVNLAVQELDEPPLSGYSLYDCAMNEKPVNNETEFSLDADMDISQIEENTGLSDN